MKRRATRPVRIPTRSRPSAVCRCRLRRDNSTKGGRWAARRLSSSACRMGRKSSGCVVSSLSLCVRARTSIGIRWTVGSMDATRTSRADRRGWMSGFGSACGCGWGTG